MFSEKRQTAAGWNIPACNETEPRADTRVRSEVRCMSDLDGDLVDGRVTTVHKAGTYQVPESVDQDIRRMADEWDLVDIEFVEHVDVSELSLLSRLGNTVEISSATAGDGVDILVTSPFGGSRRHGEVSLLCDEDGLAEGEEITLRARQVDDDGTLFLPLEESPIVRLSHDSVYRDLEDDETEDALDGRMTLDVDLPLFDRANGALLRVWRQWRRRAAELRGGIR